MSGTREGSGVAGEGVVKREPDWKQRVNCITAPRIFAGIALAMAGEACFRLAAVVGGGLFLEIAAAHGVGRAKDAAMEAQ